MYFFKSIHEEVFSVQQIIASYNKTTKLALFSIFSCIAALLQSAGGFFPGIGYMISPLATAPILLSTLFSFRFGLMTYVVTIFLLVILQPSELIIFPFTTGLLGLGIGIAFRFFQKRISIFAFSSICLTLGIITVLYLFRFPILGPLSSDSFSFFTFSGICLFTFFYSSLWVEIGLFLFNRMKIIILK